MRRRQSGPGSSAECGKRRGCRRRRRPEQGLRETRQGILGLIHIYSEQATGMQVFVSYLFPHCAHSLFILSYMREILRQTFKNPLHSSNQATASKCWPPSLQGECLDRVSPGSASVPQQGLRKPAGASPPGTGTWHPGAPRQGLGRRSPGHTLLHVCLCPARVATVWPGRH